MITARALLFDVDGLMVDSEPLWFEVERDFARSRGGDWTFELAHAAIGKGLANTLRIMADLGMRVDPARDSAEVVDRFLARASEVTAKPGCRELLAAAKGVVPLAAASRIRAANRVRHARGTGARSELRRDCDGLRRRAPKAGAGHLLLPPRSRSVWSLGGAWSWRTRSPE